MNIGDYVQINVGKPLKGFIVEPLPPDHRGLLQGAIREYWNKNSVWILITHTPDGKFVGRTYPFHEGQIEVLSEGR